MLDTLHDLKLPRGMGIGLHDAEVIAAVIGTGARRDLTVLGQGVNEAARLCSLARSGEIVATVHALPSDEHLIEGFSSPETIVLKGHTTPLVVCRRAVTRPPATAGL